MQKNDAVSEYMSKIGRKGGRKTTPAQSRARRMNAKKAAEARRK